MTKISASKEGDEILFGAATFTQAITIPHGLTIKGKGTQKSILTGSVTLTASNGITGLSFDGLTFSYLGTDKAVFTVG